MQREKLYNLQTEIYFICVLIILKRSNNFRRWNFNIM